MTVRWKIKQEINKECKEVGVAVLNMIAKENFTEILALSNDQWRW